MAIFVEHAVFDCPSCRERIEVHKQQDFSTRFGKREPIVCPHCNARAVWRKGPHNIAHYSLWVAVLTFPLPFLGVYDAGIGVFVLLGALLCCAFGLMFQQLEPCPEENPEVSRDSDQN